MTDLLIAQLRRRAADARVATDEANAGDVVPPVDEGSISRAEAALGCPMPPLLRDVYRRVGDGGFGPGYGLLRLLPDPRASDVESAIGLYTAFCSRDPEDAEWSWPAHLLPFCDWGCAIRTCVDCSTPDGTVVTFDPNVRDIGEPMSNALAVTHASLHAWFSDWIAGVKIWDVMFERDFSRARTGINPFTKKTYSFVPAKLRRPES